MISFDEFIKQDDEEKYNNMQCDMFQIQALEDELKNRDIYISKLEVAYSKELERLNNIIEEVREYTKQLIDLKEEDYLKSVNLIYIEKILEILEILDKSNEMENK